MVTTTIAHFSAIRATAYVIFNLVVCSVILSIALYYPSGSNFLEYAMSNERLHRPLVLIGLLLAPFLIFLQFRILWQIAFQNCRAIWIFDGRLNFVNFYRSVFFSSVPIQSIDHLSIKPPQSFRSGAIILYLKEGGERVIPTALLVESRETILSLLSETLSQ